MEQVVSALNKAWRQVKQTLRHHEDEAEKTSLHDEEYTSLLEAARASIYDIGQLVEEINQPINQDTAQDVHKCCQVPQNPQCSIHTCSPHPVYHLPALW